MPQLPDKYTLGRRPTPRPGTRSLPKTGHELEQYQAMRQLSGAVQNLGVTIDKVQDEQDKARAEEGYNQLIERQNELTFGEDGFTQKKSGDAANGKIMETYDGRFETAVQEIGDGMANPRQQRYFKKRADVARLRYKQDILRHVSNETETYKDETAGASLKTSRRDAMMRWNDPVAVKTNIARSDGIINEMAKRKGWNKKVTDQAKLEARSAIHIGVIQQAINNQSPLKAREWFDANKKDIDPDKYDDIERLIKGADLTKLVQDVTDDAMNRGLELTDAMAEVKKKYDGIEREKIVAGLKAAYGEEQAAADDRAWEIYAETKDLDQVKLEPGLWGKMSGRTKELLTTKVNAAKKGDMKTDRKQYAYLRNLYINKPAIFMDPEKTPLDRFTLSMSDYQEFVDLQAGQTNLGDAQSKAKIISSTIAALGHDPKDLTKDGATGDNVREIESRLNDEIRREAEVKKRKLTDNEIRDISKRMQIQVTREKIWGWVPFTGGEKPIGGIKEIKGIPADEMYKVDEIAQWVQKNVPPVTEEKIVQRYREITIPTGVRAPYE